MNQRGFIQVPILIAIIVGVLVLGGAYVTVKRFSQPIGQLSVPSSVEKSPQQNTASNTAPAINAVPIVNANSLFGTMIAFNINEAAMDMSDAIQGGWTEFRKDDTAYKKLLSNLKKLIQDRTKLVKATGFSPDRGSFGYFTWNVIEPQKGQFDWGLTDMYTQGASNAGVKISAVIQPFASWDQKGVQTNKGALDFAYYDYKAGPPNDLVEYENFLTKTVERYKGKVSVWEIANEPDSPDGGYQNNPKAYFNLLKISSETIRKADPSAKVVNGGASGFANTNNGEKNFWTNFFELGGGQYIDYFNLHYNIERSQSAKLDSAAFEEDLKIYNNLMDKNGGRKPLYLTEFGIYSGAPSEPAPMAGGPTQEPGQTQTNLLTQPPQSGPSPNQSPSSGKCGDGICDAFEKANPNACPQDCGGSALSGSPGQYQSQPPQGQAPNKNIQPNQGGVLPKLSENAQAVLYFKDSVLAFANGAKVVFIDLVGPDNSIVGSSMAFNTDGQPRLFLTALKTVNQKLAGFSKVEKIANGQYKFTIGNKIIYALWSGNLPTAISGQVKVTNLIGEEKLMNVQEIKFSNQNPVLVKI